MKRLLDSDTLSVGASRPAPLSPDSPPKYHLSRNAQPPAPRRFSALLVPTSRAVPSDTASGTVY